MEKMGVAKMEKNGGEMNLFFHIVRNGDGSSVIAAADVVNVVCATTCEVWSEDRKPYTPILKSRSLKSWSILKVGRKNMFYMYLELSRMLKIN